MAKRKPLTIGKLKKKLWAIFSLYIKLKHSHNGKWCSCITCDKPIKIGTKDCQGGHYWSKGGYGALYFDENNVRPQCYVDNCHREGETQMFGRALLEELGPKEMDRMYNERNDPHKHPRCWYLENIEYYTEEVKLLKERFEI